MSVENLPFRLYSERYRIRGGGGSKCWVLGLVAGRLVAGRSVVGWLVAGRSVGRSSVAGRRFYVAVGVKKPRNLYGLRGYGYGYSVTSLIKPLATSYLMSWAFTWRVISASVTVLPLSAVWRSALCWARATLPVAVYIAFPSKPPKLIFGVATFSTRFLVFLFLLFTF